MSLVFLVSQKSETFYRESEKLTGPLRHSARTRRADGDLSDLTKKSLLKPSPSVQSASNRRVNSVSALVLVLFLTLQSPLIHNPSTRISCVYAGLQDRGDTRVLGHLEQNEASSTYLLSTQGATMAPFRTSLQRSKGGWLS